MNIYDIPRSYEQWRHCITVICGQPLTLPYIEARLAALNSPTDHMTASFVRLYGEPQRLKTLDWFKRAKQALEQNQP